MQEHGILEIDGNAELVNCKDFLLIDTIYSNLTFSHRKVLHSAAAKQEFSYHCTSYVDVLSTFCISAYNFTSYQVDLILNKLRSTTFNDIQFNLINLYIYKQFNVLTSLWHAAASQRCVVRQINCCVTMSQSR